MLAIAASMEWPRSFSIGSKSDTVVPRSIVPAVCDRAAGMQQGFEQHGFAGAGVTREGHVADLLGGIRHEAVSPVVVSRAIGPSVHLEKQAVMAVRCGSAAVRAGARRAVMAVSGASRTSSLPQRVAGVKLCVGRRETPGLPPNRFVAVLATADAARSDHRRQNQSITPQRVRCPFCHQRSIAMGISRYATAHWQGDLKSGKGKLSTPASGLLADTPYGFNTAIRRPERHQSGGVDRGRACGLLHDGAVGAS